MSKELFKAVVGQVQGEIYKESTLKYLDEAKQLLKYPHEDACCDCINCQAIDKINKAIRVIDGVDFQETKDLQIQQAAKGGEL
ncbi:hypothetical protein LCGC14_1147210 [marine sediment metagenome]|uniref:Uncharacterized protein n=1 Tax=marine sediment metagenome TaxID=412755 RepID=A0A0F9Q277_9ZZZZ